MARFALLAVLACLALAPRALAQEVAGPRRTFELGVEAYRAADWPRARQFWLSVLEHEGFEREVDRAALYANLGNASARLGATLEAVAWYTAALDVDPRRDDARRNLEFARREAKLEPADKGDLGATLARLVGGLRAREAAWLSIGASLAFLLALVAEALVGGKVAKRATIALGALALASLAPWWVAQRRERADLLFVVAQGGADLRSEPRGDATSLERLPAASRARQLDAIPDWIKVESEEHGAGWVRADQLFETPR